MRIPDSVLVDNLDLNKELVEITIMTRSKRNGKGKGERGKGKGERGKGWELSRLDQKHQRSDWVIKWVVVCILHYHVPLFKLI